MIDLSIFTRVDGTKKEKDLVFLGLSTCGFCKRAKAFLNEEGFSYHYVDVDKLDRDTRLAVKADIKERFTPNLLYPLIIIDDKEYLSGFKKDQWIEKLQ
jgi:glutaredoxin